MLVHHILRQCSDFPNECTEDHKDIGDVLDDVPDELVQGITSRVFADKTYDETMRFCRAVKNTKFVTGAYQALQRAILQCTTLKSLPQRKCKEMTIGVLLNAPLSNFDLTPLMSALANHRVAIHAAYAQQYLARLVWALYHETELPYDLQVSYERINEVGRVQNEDGSEPRIVDGRFVAVKRRQFRAPTPSGMVFALESLLVPCREMQSMLESLAPELRNSFWNLHKNKFARCARTSREEWQYTPLLAFDNNDVYTMQSLSMFAPLRYWKTMAEKHCKASKQFERFFQNNAHGQFRILENWYESLAVTSAHITLAHFISARIGMLKATKYFSLSYAGVLNDIDDHIFVQVLILIANDIANPNLQETLSFQPICILAREARTYPLDETRLAAIKKQLAPIQLGADWEAMISRFPASPCATWYQHFILGKPEVASSTQGIDLKSIQDIAVSSESDDD